MKLQPHVKSMRSLFFAFLPLVLFTLFSLSRVISDPNHVTYTCQTNQGILLEATDEFITVVLADGKKILYKEMIVQHSTNDFHYFEAVNRNANAQKIELSIRKNSPKNTYEFTAVLGSEAYSGNAKAKFEGI